MEPDRLLPLLQPQTFHVLVSFLVHPWSLVMAVIAVCSPPLLQVCHCGALCRHSKKSRWCGMKVACNALQSNRCHLVHHHGRVTA